LWISILPVVLPILLITGNTISGMLDEGRSVNGILSTLGDPNMALAISAAIAIFLLWSRLKDLTKFKKFITEALTSAGIIILITSSGGAFGQILQQTGIGIRVAELAVNYQMALLPLAFFITAVVRTAQGSATIAMVTAIGIMSGIGSADLQFHPVYLAKAIGCGSKIFAWMNDSAFWIITKMSGMEEKETIRHFSMLLIVMGISGLIAVMVLSRIFPLI
jgi:GntP family gluconate:H+ symporter